MQQLSICHPMNLEFFRPWHMVLSPPPCDEESSIVFVGTPCTANPYDDASPSAFFYTCSVSQDLEITSSVHQHRLPQVHGVGGLGFLHSCTSVLIGSQVPMTNFFVCNRWQICRSISKHIFRRIGLQDGFGCLFERQIFCHFSSIMNK